MNNAFKMLGDFIAGLAGLLMSLIGLAIIVQVAGLTIPGIDVFQGITDAVTTFVNPAGGFVGLVALLVVLGFLKK
jgi:hypothetical protein